jgi:pimeloyl-ACP methyl ester carboxylesterase
MEPAMSATKEGTFLTDDGIELSYAESGDGFPVILVNGLGNLKEAWAETVASFDRYFRVIRYNLRNQGKNVAGHGTDYTTQRHVLDLDRLLQHLGIDRFVGAGISTGARILIDHALAYPDKVHGLTLMGVATENLNHRNTVIFKSWLNALESSADEDMVRYVETYIPWIYGPDYLSAVAVPVRQIADGLSNTMTKAGTAENIKSTLNSLDEAYVTASRGGTINSPVLILQGEYDLMAPPGCLDDLSKRFSKHKMTIVPRVGHNIRGENRSAFERHALDFLLGELEL